MSRGRAMKAQILRAPELRAELPRPEPQPASDAQPPAGGGSADALPF